MTMRVLIIGGYGNFGRFIARRLSAHSAITVIIAGRSEAKAKGFAASLEGAEGFRLDINEGLDEGLAAARPDLVIHTSGPFQGQGYDVAETCIRAGINYIDLADGRGFVEGIDTLDTAAKAAGVSVVSGASSVPGLSSAVIDAYLDRFTALEHIDYGITTAQATTRGLATTAAILGYTGKAFARLEGDAMRPVYGWQNLHAHSFPDVGTRYLSNCDIPDLGLFPKRYPTLQSQRFYAGLELSILHIGLWGLSWLVRLGLIRNLRPWAPTLLKTSFLFDMMGTDVSAFYMRMRGKGHDGLPHEVRFDLVARSGDGPFIPCMPAILLAERLAAGEALPKGALPCMGLVTLEKYLKALEPLDIDWTVSED